MICHGVKEMTTNMAVLKMIIQQRADEKLQLKKSKTSLINSLVAKILQLYKMYEKSIELKYKEIKK